MKEIYTEQYPEPVVIITKFGQTYAILHILITNTDNESEGKYKCVEIVMPPFEFGYSEFVNAIISAKYSNDKMQAIINNYLLDTEDEEAKKEFIEMQQIRTLAKEEAKKCLDYAKENNLTITN